MAEHRRRSLHLDHPPPVAAHPHRTPPAMECLRLPRASIPLLAPAVESTNNLKAPPDSAGRSCRPLRVTLPHLGACTLLQLWHLLPERSLRVQGVAGPDWERKRMGRVAQGAGTRTSHCTTKRGWCFPVQQPCCSSCPPRPADERRPALGQASVQEERAAAGQL